MKKMLICLMFFVTIPVVAQVRLGNPLDSIKKEFPATNYKVDSGTTPSGELYYAVATSIAQVVYYFDIYNNCEIVRVAPNTEDKFSWYKEKYNRDYKKVSDTRWLASDNNLVADVYLMHPDSISYKDGSVPYFVWIFAEESSMGHSFTAEEYFHSGNAKQDLQNYSGASADFTKAIEINPMYDTAYYGRGISKLNLLDYEGSILDLSKAIELNPEFLKAYISRGAARKSIEDNSGAILDFTKAIEIKPEFSWSYIYRGEARSSIQDYNGAFDDYTNAISLDPGNEMAYFERALTKVKIQDYVGGIIDATKVIDINPKNMKAYFIRGLSNIKLDKRDIGCSDLRKASESGAAMASDAIKEYCH